MGAGAAAIAVPAVPVELAVAAALSSGVVGQGVEDLSAGGALDPVRLGFAGILNLAGGVGGLGVTNHLLSRSEYAGAAAVARGLSSVAPRVAEEAFIADMKAAGVGIGASASSNGLIDLVVGSSGW